MRRNRGVTVAKLSVEQALAKAKSHIKRGEVAEAQTLYATILKAFPNNKKAQQGLNALGGGRRSAAEQGPPQGVIDQLINLYNQGQFEAVVEQAKNLTTQFPKAIALWKMLGAASAQIGKLEQAFIAFKNVIAINPNDPKPHNNIGNVLKDQGRLEEAVKAYNKAVSLKPDYAEAYLNMGNALNNQIKLVEAVKAYNKAISLKPNYSQAYLNMGNALKNQGELERAIESYNKALVINPGYAEVYYNMGIALADQGKLVEAVDAFNKALAIKPDYADAYYNMGVTFQDQGKLEEAIDACNKALAINPDYGEAYCNMGNTLKEQGKLDEAIEAYNKAIAIKPDYADAYYNMGVTLQDQGKLVEAIDAYNKALDIKPDYESARVQKLHQKAHICDWNSMTADRTLIPKLGTTNNHVSPFALLSLEDAPERHLIRSEIYAAATYPNKPLPRHVRVSKKPKRLQVGYFSADFHNFPGMHLMIGLLEQHDRKKFEITAFSYGPDSSDEMRNRIVNAVDHFVDIKTADVNIVNQLAKQKKIDIAIHRNGYTKNSRTELFSSRIAPIQINYLGYPGTLGARFIDYIVADPILIPVNKRQYYSEKIIYLPNTYQPTDNRRVISNKTMKRENMGLPNQGFVFCCFNNNYKISPAEFDIWMRLLNNVEGSVLWLLKSNELATQNLKQQAESRGISADRVIFAERLPQAEHLARQRLADLFLDTFNYNAHTTTSDALWAGLPVVTKMGQGFAARVAGSLLAAVGLPELITLNEEDYEALILELATNPTKLAKIKEKLVINRLTQPLFNTELYTRHLENGYQQAYQNYLDGNSPQTITVPG